MPQRANVGFQVSGRRGMLRPQFYALRRGSELGDLGITITNRLGGVIGKFRSDIERSIINSLEFTIDERGNANFTLQLNALPPFSIDPYSFIEVTLFNTSFKWYCGVILDVPDFGVRRQTYRYSGQGLVYYLTGPNALKADTDYAALLDVGEVVADLAVNYITPFCPIQYDSSKIDDSTGVVLANAIELSKMPLADVLDTLADMAGAYWGVDGDRNLYFLMKSTANYQTRFVGYDFYTFEPETNNREIKNTILVQRQDSRGSGGSGWALAGNYSDTTSVSKYGKRELVYQVPGYFSNSDADIIGAALLAKYKDPQTSAKFTAPLTSELDYFRPSAVYRAIMPYDDQNRVWLDLDSAAAWSKVAGAGDSAVYDDTTYFVYGSGGIRFDYQTASGDAWRTRLDFSTGRIVSINFYVRATVTGAYLTVGVGSTDWDDYTWPMAVPVGYQFFKIDLDLESLGLTDLSYFGFSIDSNQPNPSSLWLDKVEVICKEHKTYKLASRSTTYILSADRGSIVQGELGVVRPNMGDYVEGLIKSATEFKFVTEQR